MTTTTVPATPKTSNDRLHQIRIVIADDHPVVRIGVKNMLQSDARVVHYVSPTVAAASP